MLNIELYYFPPYSPNLNPIERLWKVMNEKVRNNRYFTSPKGFREEIRRFFNEILPKLAGTLAYRINNAEKCNLKYGEYRSAWFEAILFPPQNIKVFNVTGSRLSLL